MLTVERDVIVVGAGPAGSICAAYMAREGLDVLMLDKDIFPRDKACGDMQCEGIVTHVNELGAFEELDAMSTCIRRLRLVSNSGSEGVMPFECYCAPRYEFDALMVATAVKWGVEFRQGCRVTGVIEEKGYVRGVKALFRGKEAELRSKLVIAADGAYSFTGKKLGVMREVSSATYLGERAYFKGVKLDSSLSHGRYDTYGMFCFDEGVLPGYIWVVPSGRRGVEEGYCNVGIIAYDRDSCNGRHLQGMFSETLKRVPGLKVMFDRAEQVSPWKGGKLADVNQNIRKAGNGFMVIGDAAAVMMPLRSDGLSAAADSAKEAALKAAEAVRLNDFSEEFLISGQKMVSENQLKLIRLTQQSMYDPAVIDRIIYDMSHA